jgi:hypothetical protein
MAIFTPGALIASIHGALGGTTFRRAPGAPVVQSNPAPSHSASGSQLSRRPLFELARYYWTSVCTPAQRKDWLILARALRRAHTSGPSPTLTGRQLFFRQYLLPWPSVYNITDPLFALISQPILDVRVDFTVGGPYTIDFSLCPPPYTGPFLVTACRRLPAPSWSSLERWKSSGSGPTATGTYDWHTQWVLDLGELDPDEIFCVGIYFDPKGPDRKPLSRFYGTAHT